MTVLVIVVFWAFAPCNIFDVFRRFGELLLSSLGRESNSVTLKMEQYVPPKRRNRRKHYMAQSTRRKVKDVFILE